MIRAFADTNWLTALYFDQPTRTRILRAWSRKERPVLMTSLPVLLEARNVFARTTEENPCAEWKALLEDCGKGLQVTAHGWPEIVAEAEKLIDRYAHKGSVSTADCVVLASAWISGASWFLSFDQNSGARALASVLKMAVYPEVNIRDKQLAAQFRM
jgi:predicted nucleic acid-binding protein